MHSTSRRSWLKFVLEFLDFRFFFGWTVSVANGRFGLGLTYPLRKCGKPLFEVDWADDPTSVFGNILSTASGEPKRVSLNWYPGCTKGLMAERNEIVRTNFRCKLHQGKEQTLWPASDFSTLPFA